MKSHQFCLQQRERTHTIMCQPQVTKAASLRFCNKPARASVRARIPIHAFVFSKHLSARLNPSFVRVSIRSNVNSRRLWHSVGKKGKQARLKEKAASASQKQHPNKSITAACLLMYKGFFCCCFQEGEAAADPNRTRWP